MDLDRLSLANRRDLVKQVVTGWDHVFGPWLMEQTGGTWHSGRGFTIGLFDTDSGRILGATLYELYNGASLLMHCAGSGRGWLSRDFLWYAFYYPFEQLGVRKLISPIDSDNLQARKFIEHIGFILEGTLKDASPKGNLLLYTMQQQDCKWLSLKGIVSGQR